MAFTKFGIFEAGCLALLLVVSCGFSDDKTAGGMADAERIADTDTSSVLLEKKKIEYFRAAHILITWNTPAKDTSGMKEDALETIQNIQDSILSGQAAFEEMAFDYSDCTSAADSGLLPAFTAGGITEELDSTISALAPGEISGIIRTRFGYHLVKRLGS